MVRDILTVMRKELIEVTRARSRFGGLVSILMIVGVYGVFMPFMTGRDWVAGPSGLIGFAWLPLFLAVGMVADAFAGERERHTLETLLASRLPDQAILLGKTGAAVTYCTTISATSLLLGGVAANFASLGQGFVYYSAGLVLITLGATIILSSLLSAVGVLVSLRAATVRQAYQRVSFSLLGVWLLVFVLARFLPPSAAQAAERMLESVDLVRVGILATLLLIALTVALYGVALARFRRSRLVGG